MWLILRGLFQSNFHQKNAQLITGSLHLFHLFASQHDFSDLRLIRQKHISFNPIISFLQKAHIMADKRVFLITMLIMAFASMGETRNLLDNCATTPGQLTCAADCFPSFSLSPGCAYECRCGSAYVPQFTTPSSSPRIGRCFPGSSLVTTPAGPKQMNQLALGDSVLTVSNSGAVEFNKVSTYFLDTTNRQQKVPSLWLSSILFSLSGVHVYQSPPPGDCNLCASHHLCRRQHHAHPRPLHFLHGQQELWSLKTVPCRFRQPQAVEVLHCN